jgi:hypothetical protein
MFRSPRVGGAADADEPSPPRAGRYLTLPRVGRDPPPWSTDRTRPSYLGLPGVFAARTGGVGAF